jgi:cyclophilin family peptidyl-prolyl cis-trans isomerase
MSAEIADFVHKATALSAQLETSAEQAYAADANNRRAGDLLLTMAVAALRKDDFDRAAQVAKFLIDHHYPGGEPLRIAASSAFATMQFDDAKKYLAELAIVNPGDPTSAAMQSAIDRYEPKWQREQKLRAAETKADDLPRVKLKTTQGDILVELFENDAPNTVANFISLVEKHFYDGSQFHRVLPGFMAQGGDPLSKDPKNDPATIGSGGPGYTIPDECNLPNHREHFRGSLSMAHTGEPNSGGSQFFICFVPTEQLDGKYTVFGRVIEGLDVLAKLQRIDPSKEKEHSLGLLPDRIEKAEVLRKRDHAYEPTTIGKKPVAAP